jgi:tetratricopeptide (TPR) repeat protein
MLALRKRRLPPAPGRLEGAVPAALDDHPTPALHSFNDFVKGLNLWYFGGGKTLSCRRQSGAANWVSDCNYRSAMPSSFKTLPLAVILCCGVLRCQPPAPNPADALFQSAVGQLSQGRYQEAEESFRKLAELEPTTSRGMLGIAEVWTAQKKEGDALRMLQAEAGKYPARPELHFGIGNLAMRTAQYDLAIAEFLLVLDRVDRNSKGAADLYLRMGEAYRRKGDLDFAIAVLGHAQTLQPANPAILTALAFTLESAGQRQAAGDQYRKILELDPKNALALNNLAFMLADSGTDPGLALAYAHRARQLLPNEPTITDTLGWVYLKLNRPEDAITLFREVVQKDPRRAAYRYHLAAALELKGDHAEARKESEAALKSNPSKDEEEKIHELLRKIRE